MILRILARNRHALLAGFTGLALAVGACSEAPNGPVGPDPGSPLGLSAVQSVIVTPADMNGWAFFVDNSGGTGALVSGPGVTPLGNGSANLNAAISTDGMALGVLAYAGTRLDDIDGLAYSTYRTAGGPALAIALQFNIDTDLTDAIVGWQGRLVYEPYHTQTVSTGAWQTWDPQDDNAGTGTGNWWFSGAPGNGTCPQSNPCTWTEVVAAFPNAGIHGNPLLGGVVFKAGSGWTGFDGNVDAFTISIVGGDATTFDFEPYGACSFTTSGTTMTLDADCTTDTTILVPDGFTLDGDGHTITAIDPVAGHFVGGVVENAGTVAHVTNLGITTDGLANVCDGGDDRLRGILFAGAAGSITNNTVNDINQGSSGCQEGNAIEVRNAPFDGTHPNTLAVTISGNTMDDYQKTGIVANGDVSVVISANDIEGLGPVNFIAQNGIQLGFGATGQATDNSVTGNWYTPEDWTAAGILLFQANAVDVKNNTLTENQVGVDAETWCSGGGSASDNRIMKNKVTGAQVGVIVAAYDLFGAASCNPTANNNKVTNNRITEPDSDGDTGVFVGTSDDNPLNAFTPVADNNKVVNNVITGYATPIDLDGDSSTKVHSNEPSGP